MVEKHFNISIVPVLSRGGSLVRHTYSVKKKNVILESVVLIFWNYDLYSWHVMTQFT
jgi:hypothetical protein